MTIDIRRSGGEDMKRFLTVCESAFGEGAAEEDVARFSRLLPADRTWAAWDGGDMVGTAGSYPFHLAIPGGTIPASGVTMVGVLPSHTRRGILTEMMKETLEHARAGGESVGVLWASEGSIYGRYGYGVATKQSRIEADVKVAWRDSSPPRGRVRLVPPLEAIPELSDVYERIHTISPGTAARSEDWWRYHRLDDNAQSRGRAGPLFCALLELDGRTEGYALYRVEQEWASGFANSTLRVAEALGGTPEATREIWRFLFKIDLVARVEGWWLPIDHPLFLMVAEPRRLKVGVTDALWLRLVDARAALSERSYGAEDRIVIELTDRLLPGNEGVWALDTRAGDPVIERVSEEADVALDISDLGSLFLGGFTTSDLLKAGLGEAKSEGAAARMDALFGTPTAPFCPEIF